MSEDTHSETQGYNKDSLSINLKEDADFTPPWEIRTYPEDKYGFIRTQFVTQNRWESGVWGGLGNVIFKHPLDRFSEEDFAELPQQITKPGEQRPTILDMDTESVINYLLNNEKVHESEEMQLLKREDHPTANPLYANVLRALGACSLFDRDGQVKPYNDGEGYMLLAAWLSAKSWTPKLSQKYFKELMDRTKYLCFEDTEAQEQAKITEILKEKPSWGMWGYKRRKASTFIGEIEGQTYYDKKQSVIPVPFEKIYVTHVTDYLPAVGDYPAIMPRIDTDGAARWTVHTFANGMVEPHGGATGMGNESWEGNKYCVVFNFKDSLAETGNGIPTSVFQPDTFWSIRPGRGLQLPKGSFLLVPESEVHDLKRKYQESGLEVIGYQEGSLRKSVKGVFGQKDIPFFEDVDPTDADEQTRQFAGEIGSDYSNHANMRIGSLDRFMNSRLQPGIKTASRYQSMEGRLSREGAEELSSVYSNVDIYMPVKKAFAWALNRARKSITDQLTSESRYSPEFSAGLKRRYAHGALETAVVAGLI